MQHPELSKGTSNGVALRLIGQGTSDDCEDAAGLTLAVESLSSSGTSEGITLQLGMVGRCCEWADASGVVLVMEFFVACFKDLLFLAGMFSLTASLIIRPKRDKINFLAEVKFQL